MTWDFMTTRDIKSTKKEHECLTCERKIPIGKPAFNWRGKFDGEMQNSYMCRFCYENDIGFDEEIISGDEFADWLREQDFMKCPSCQSEQRYDFDWMWDSEHENVIISCDECEHKWVVPIGWGEKGGAE